MNLEEIWQKHQPSDDAPPDLHEAGKLKHAQEMSALKSIKKKLKINMIWALLIAMGYLFVLLRYHYWQIQLFISIALIFTLWAAWSARGLYLAIEPQVQPNNLLNELQRNSDALKAWIRLQNRVALFVYPFCIAGGFLLGGVMRSGKSVSELLERPLMMYSLITAILLMTPASYFLAKWMFRVSFGKLHDRLEDNIKSLTNIN